MSLYDAMSLKIAREKRVQEYFEHSVLQDSLMRRRTISRWNKIIAGRGINQDEAPIIEEALPSVKEEMVLLGDTVDSLGLPMGLLEEKKPVGGKR
jgi:hypothetical protein